MASNAYTTRGGHASYFRKYRRSNSPNNNRNDRNNNQINYRKIDRSPKFEHLKQNKIDIFVRLNRSADEHNLPGIAFNKYSHSGLKNESQETKEIKATVECQTENEQDTVDIEKTIHHDISGLKIEEKIIESTVENENIRQKYIKKSYNRNELIKFNELPDSKVKPIINREFFLIIGRESITKTLLSSISPDRTALQQSLLPSFEIRHRNKKIESERLQQQSLDSSKTNSVNKGIVRVSLSLNEEVKLKESENAWRPKLLYNPSANSPEKLGLGDVRKKVRGILNKLTPEKFEKLVDAILNLQIDSAEKINEVMILVFEKAIDEPNFSESYALLCKRLSTEVKVLGDDVKKQALFKTALIDKTEHEFTHNISKNSAKDTKLQPIIDQIAECKDSQEKLELQTTLEEQELKFRRRCSGAVRFIGELFKISMLTARIIRQCVNNLLDPSSQDKLECLCKLLMVVGQKYEQTPSQDLTDIIKKMETICERKGEYKISSRIRFMIQDVVDLRKNNWISKHTEKPKTMEQIEKEVKTEQMATDLAIAENTSIDKSENSKRSLSAPSGNALKQNEFMEKTGEFMGNISNYKQNKKTTWQAKNNQPTEVRKLGDHPIDTNKLAAIKYSTVDTTTKLGGADQYLWRTGGVMSQTSKIPTNLYSSVCSNVKEKNDNIKILRSSDGKSSNITSITTAPTAPTVITNMATMLVSATPSTAATTSRISSDNKTGEKRDRSNSGQSNSDASEWITAGRNRKETTNRDTQYGNQKFNTKVPGKTNIQQKSGVHNQDRQTTSRNESSKEREYHPNYAKSNNNNNNNNSNNNNTNNNSNNNNNNNKSNRKNNSSRSNASKSFSRNYQS